MDPIFWKDKSILITGHTGFKGGWLSLWLSILDANVIGFSLQPPTNPSFFDACGLSQRITSINGDVRDIDSLKTVCEESKPEVLVHMAAQPIVRQSYEDPIETYATNVMGTVNVLETARQCESIKVVLIITSDKCYENREWPWGYREIDPMGGFDPYSCSKGCAELITASYRQSFFADISCTQHAVAVASARAGNVIGGGDWGKDRLIPDIFKSVAAGTPLQIRSPEAIRPWQHVLDPLHGYLRLIERLYNEGNTFSDGWNFGPFDSNCQTVAWILLELKQSLGDRLQWVQDKGPHPHEAHFLKLDCSKAHQRLNWRPKLDLATALQWTAEWYQGFERGDDILALSEKQIERFKEME
ncbi:CDP-glucose 4,6-dehydratase [Desulfosarcina ovata]|nr:CDP-glucose 4,6-dehydratase [Desulfosarcina ovata]